MGFSCSSQRWCTYSQFGAGVDYQRRPPDSAWVGLNAPNMMQIWWKCCVSCVVMIWLSSDFKMHQPAGGFDAKPGVYITAPLSIHVNYSRLLSGTCSM